MTTTTCTFSRAAEIMGLQNTRAHSAADRAKARIIALFGVECTRCGGTGSWNATNYRGESRCYGCDGHGFVSPVVTEEMAHEAKTLKDAGALDGYFAQAKLRSSMESPFSPVQMGRAMIDIFAEIAAFAAEHETRCVAIESSHATACVKFNEMLRAGRRAEIRRFGIPGTSRRSFEVWAL